MSITLIKRLSMSATLIVAISASSIALADKKDGDDVIDTGVISPCQYLIPTAPFNPDPATQPVCVDVPVSLKDSKVVFNFDHEAIRPAKGSNPAIPVGMRHMIMLSNGIKNRIAAGKVEAEDVSVIGVFQGSKAGAWLLSNEWWVANVEGATGNPYAGAIMKLKGLKAAGINIQLEICGVTMTGKGWTNADVFPGVLVNQGAVGRLIDLQHDDYAVIHSDK